MRIAIGSDHAGWKLKQEIMTYLTEAGHSYEDVGCYNEDSCDYPDIARKVAQAVTASQGERGILVCHSGIGMCMTANKVAGVRAALCHDARTSRLSREHNDANVLCLGQGFIEPTLAKEMVQVFLSTPFAGDRHARRVGKMMELDGPRQGPRGG